MRARRVVVRESRLCLIPECPRSSSRAHQAKPLPYPVKPHVRSSFTGRQMITNPPKEGLHGAKHPDVYLDKTHAWIAEGVPYVDRITYAEAQREKKSGFGTSDFSRRDEFTMDFRTEQYREALKSETRRASEATNRACEAIRRATTEAASDEDDDSEEARLRRRGAILESSSKKKKKENWTFFDSVFDDGDGKTAVPNSMRPGRPSRNPTQVSWERNYGTAKTSAMECGYGVAAAPHGKPQFARMPVLNATVYRPCAIPITQTTALFSKRPR